MADGWGNGFDGGRTFGGWVVEHLHGDGWWQGALLLGGGVLLLALLVLAFRDRQPLPLLVLGATLLALALMTTGYFGSKPRYLLPAYPLLLPLALRLSRLRLRTAAGVLGVLAATSAAYGAVWLLGPGPP